MLTEIDLDRLIADTEATILDLVADAEDERTRELYRMVRYHLGLLLLWLADLDGARTQLTQAQEAEPEGVTV